MTGMVTDWDIYGELVFEVQRYLWNLGVDVQYDWLAQWPLLVAGQSLPVRCGCCGWSATGSGCTTGDAMAQACEVMIDVELLRDHISDAANKAVRRSHL